MAETLGSLCDKLTIVKLKQYHSRDKERLRSLKRQKDMLTLEIDEFISNAASGRIPKDKLTFRSNKVFARQKTKIRAFKGTIGHVVSALAEINCMLWHAQEKVYEFEKVAPKEKDRIVKQLAILNLERTNCIDEIDTTLAKLV